MLTLNGGLGDACDPADPAGSPSACAACSGDWGIPGTCGATCVAPTFNYSSWPCSQCSNWTDPCQLNFCNQACGNAAAMTSVQPNLTSQAVSSLPAGAQASALPNLPGTPAASSIAPATNWWVIGIGAVIGISLGVYAYTRWSA